MNRTIRFVKMAALILALFAAPAALAQRGGDRGHGRRHWVPEFDPAAGGALIALLAGGGLLIAENPRDRHTLEFRQRADAEVSRRGPNLRQHVHRHPDRLAGHRLTPRRSRRFRRNRLVDSARRFSCFDLDVETASLRTTMTQDLERSVMAGRR